MQTLMLPHFDYHCSVWCPNLKNKKLKNKIQTSENKCIYFCMQLNKMSHASQKELETINLILIKEGCNA